MTKLGKLRFRVNLASVQLLRAIDPAAGSGGHQDLSRHDSTSWKLGHGKG